MLPESCPKVARKLPGSCLKVALKLPEVAGKLPRDANTEMVTKIAPVRAVNTQNFGASVFVTTTFLGIGVGKKWR